jgi:hypothetical protein
MKLHSTARALGLGRAAYLFWHAPVAAVKKSIAAGGPIEQLCDHRAHRRMTRAATQLTPQSEPPADDWPELHFLTGKKFWDQTAFCLHSFQAHAGRVARVVFHDDGSADDATHAQLTRLFPTAQWRLAKETGAGLDVVLPADKFPVLRERRMHYPHLRKLTDVHAGHAGWRLVLDSDMLFFRRPDALLAWLAAPGRPVHMLDVGNAYGYPEATLAALAGRPLPDRLNVGICGLRSDTIDWEKLESWCARLLEQHGTSYYLEQALSALLIAGSDPLRLPQDDYLVMPTEEECLVPTAALHHYVAGSKRGYFRHAWRHALPSRSAP